MDEKTTLKSGCFRWLHFSDIHVGVERQSDLWPRFSTLLLDDLQSTSTRVGEIDLVIFSGDLAQKGLSKEFEHFDTIIGEILDCIATFQKKPQIVVVPGNHDLERPKSLSPQALALKQFWNDTNLRDGFWEKDGSQYREFIAEVFKNFLAWQRQSIDRGVHLAPVTTGILPGDASYIMETAAGKLGIAALNSAWLQLSGSDYLKELHVNVRQLHAVTDGKADDWARKNDINLLLTHHPKSWLHLTGPASWDNDINPSGRFDAHLFGHMHKPDTVSTAHGGGLARRDVQAASLFGLEKFGENQYERIQGYSANQIQITDARRVLTSWPRQLVPIIGGKMKLVPDSHQDIDEATGSFSIPYTIERQATPVSPSFPNTETAPANSAFSQTLVFDLEAIRHAVGEDRAHRKIRRVEQEVCVKGLREARVVWLTSDWGLGEDGFISSIRNQLHVDDEHIYSIDCSGYVTRKGFFEGLRTRLGFSFQQICEAIANAGPSILVLDDIDVPLLSAEESSVVGDIEELAKTVADFASDSVILIRSRKRPRTSKFVVVELKPLDEADVAIYARESEIGGDRYAKPDAASAIYRHTDGIPTLIDEALRNLEIMSLGDLISSNTDFGQSCVNLAPAPPALIATIEGLKQSEDRAEQRAYQLLLALAALPQGEQLARMKRFLGPHPIGSAHARALLERSLISAVTLSPITKVPDDFAEKTLVVPRTVREYVRDTIDDTVAKEIDQKALDLYFGQDWEDGSILHSPTGRRISGALCEGYEIHNASTLILRVVRRAIDGASQLDIDRSVRLASGFIGALIKGDHFRRVVGFCEDMMRVFDGTLGFEKEKNTLRYEYGRYLRMVGRYRDARHALEGLDQSLLSKSQRQSAELSLALCHESTGDEVSAAEAAKRTIAINRTSNTSIQAETILAAQMENIAARRSELHRLLTKSIRKKSETTSNNILIMLARDSQNSSGEKEDFLKQVIQRSRATGDFYNHSRAIIELASRPNAHKMLTGEEQHKLIEAYYFLYNERIPGLFDRCHSALWKVFECNGDNGNLLNLFRHSSFIWRLNGQDDQESKYLHKLVSNLSDLVAAGITQANRDGAYFVMRVSVIIGNTESHKLALPELSSK